MAEKYYGISPYAYCAGDPVNCVDPTGEDAYYVDSLGNVILAKKTDDDYDELYATDGSSVKVEDRSVLPELSGLGYTNSYMNQFDLFCFLGDHTSIEWALARYNDGEQTLVRGTGEDYCYTGTAPYLTSFNEVSGREVTDMIVYMHSHPDKAIPSGNYINDKYPGQKQITGNNGIVYSVWATRYGDQSNYSKLSNVLKKTIHLVYCKGVVRQYTDQYIDKPMSRGFCNKRYFK